VGGDVARMGSMRNAHNILVGKLESKIQVWVLWVMTTTTLHGVTTPKSWA
jgi:hypothetical protein